MNYLIDYTDNVLDAHPQTVIVLGGDFNQLDMDGLQQLSGWYALVDFLTPGDSHLDNCLTHRPDLFARCYPLYVSAKSDHRGVILPARSKLCPVCRKFTPGTDIFIGNRICSWLRLKRTGQRYLIPRM